mmetsp:Transcript_12611/g.39235  ORF Transcript_12611/g.39235 Transcript_12611/m.39235 type:complete len:307 (+) Transcript_12611:786-1706(+)
MRSSSTKPWKRSTAAVCDVDSDFAPSSSARLSGLLPSLLSAVPDRTLRADPPSRELLLLPPRRGCDAACVLEDGPCRGIGAPAAPPASGGKPAGAPLVVALSAGSSPFFSFCWRCCCCRCCDARSFSRMARCSCAAMNVASFSMACRRPRSSSSRFAFFVWIVRTSSCRSMRRARSFLCKRRIVMSWSKLALDSFRSALSSASRACDSAATSFPVAARIRCCARARAALAIAARARHPTTKRFSGTTAWRSNTSRLHQARARVCATSAARCAASSRRRAAASASCCRRSASRFASTAIAPTVTRAA